MTVASPIRYYGGKGNMVGRILDLFPQEELYKIYVEPYGGAGSILFNKPDCEIEIYNDLYSSVYAFYKVLSDPELFPEFKRRADLAIFQERVSNEYLQSLKNDDLSIIDRAWQYWYVNRTRRGGGQGGLSVNTVVRRKMSKSTSDFLSAIERLDYFHQRMSKVIVLNRDALDVIPHWDRKNTMMYLDPPYVQSTRTSARYNVDADDKHHRGLIDILLNIKYSYIALSGYNNSLYEDLENSGWYRHEIYVERVDGKNRRKTVEEMVWTNYGYDIMGKQDN